MPEESPENRTQSAALMQEAALVDVVGIISFLVRYQILQHPADQSEQFYVNHTFS